MKKYLFVLIVFFTVNAFCESYTIDGVTMTRNSVDVGVIRNALLDVMNLVAQTGHPFSEVVSIMRAPDPVQNPNDFVVRYKYAGDLYDTQYRMNTKQLEESPTRFITVVSDGALVSAFIGLDVAKYIVDKDILDAINENYDNSTYDSFIKTIMVNWKKYNAQDVISAYCAWKFHKAYKEAGGN